MMVIKSYISFMIIRVDWHFYYLIPCDIYNINCICLFFFIFLFIFVSSIYIYYLFCFWLSCLLALQSFLTTSIPEECYSRHMSSALRDISTCLLLFKDVADIQSCRYELIWFYYVSRYRLSGCYVISTTLVRTINETMSYLTMVLATSLSFSYPLIVTLNITMSYLTTAHATSPSFGYS